MSDAKTLGRVIRQKWITAADLMQNQNRAYVFGDNMARDGVGGQAGAMRGFANAIGVPTKWLPRTGEKAYFKPADLHNPFVRAAILGAFHQMSVLLSRGIDVVIPTDGIGTGLSQLPQRAPEIHAWIEWLIADLEGKTDG